MEPKSNPEGSKSSTPVEVVLPSAFANTTLKGAQLQLALLVGNKHPEIVQSVVELGAAMREAGEKYYHVLHALRKAKLGKKEATALLLGLGLTKGRASELNKLSSCKEEVWKKYSDKTVGFRAALALEDGKKKVPTGEQKKPRTQSKIHALPKPMQVALTEAVSGWLAKDNTLPAPMKSGKRTEYGFTYEANGQTLYFQIFADKAD